MKGEPYERNFHCDWQSSLNVLYTGTPGGYPGTRGRNSYPAGTQEGQDSNFSVSALTMVPGFWHHQTFPNSIKRGLELPARHRCSRSPGFWRSGVVGL
eukprot:1229742-Rhodomonas_salina.1